MTYRVAAAAAAGGPIVVPAAAGSIVLELLQRTFRGQAWSLVKAAINPALDRIERDLADARAEPERLAWTLDANLADARVVVTLALLLPPPEAGVLNVVAAPDGRAGRLLEAGAGARADRAPVALPRGSAGQANVDGAGTRGGAGRGSASGPAPTSGSTLVFGSGA
jgi:hypothetical protein